MRVHRWVLLACALCAGAASANVYRCDQDGRLSFGDKPCVAGQLPVEVAQPNTLETSAGERMLAQQFDAHTAALRAARAVRVAKPSPIPASVRKVTEPRPRKSARRSSSRGSKTIKAPVAEKAIVPPRENQLAPPRPR